MNRDATNRRKEVNFVKAERLSSSAQRLYNVYFQLYKFVCVPLGLLELGSMVQDHSGHGATTEPIDESLLMHNGFIVSFDLRDVGSSILIKRSSQNNFFLDILLLYFTITLLRTNMNFQAVAILI